MTYELAKELKDAGFPMPYKDQVGGFRPTLEELIEACGHSGNVSLHLDLFGEHCVARKGNHSGVGSTPTEAVARLWIALNKQTQDKSLNDDDTNQFDL